MLLTCAEAAARPFNMLTVAAVSACAVTIAPRPVILIDSGSKRAASTLALRQCSARLARLLGDREVRPASLAYSDTIEPSELDGVAARTLTTELTALVEDGAAGAVVVPLFLGPSKAYRNGISKALAMSLVFDGCVTLLVSIEEIDAASVA